MTKITPRSKPQSYKIIFCHDLLFTLKKNLNSKVKWCFVFDKNTDALFADKLACEYKVVIPGGEKYKSQSQVDKIHKFLFQNQFGRNDILITVGGGIVSDLGGFSASTYMRGMAWVNIPTTLLSMVDATIGGKTGINTAFGKNTIGQFYNPQIILLDLCCLESLPDVQIINGIAEMIKHGIIASGDHFHSSCDYADRFDQYNKKSQSLLIKESLAIKKEIIEQDPFESGKRKLLNFGHTIGHGFELVTNYRISHGYAVALGMLIEIELAQLTGSLSAADQKLIQNKLLAVLKHPTLSRMNKIIKTLDQVQMIKSLFTALHYDKKNEDKKISFCFPVKIGRAKIVYLEPAYLKPRLTKAVKNSLLSL